MPPKRRSERVQNESQLELAINAYKNGQFKRVLAAAKAYNVEESTLRRRLRGGGTRQTSQQNNRILLNTEEITLTAWILDLADRGHPLKLCHIEYMANQLLSARRGPDSKVGKCWTQRFITRNPEIRTERYRKYDYERALCEDPKMIQNWFDLVRNTINKYGIPPSDIWNFDESGFAMGVLGSGMIVTGVNSIGKQSSVQAGNREWTTTVDAINAEGAAIPPMIIFTGKLHQAAWYDPERFEPEWSIGLSDTGWTNDELGFEWLTKVFNPNTNKIRQSTWRLLIMDGHGSHATPRFDAACKELNIIPLYMPPHSSHLLQPLDVGCFSPLKTIYTKELENTFRLGINHVDKIEFLEVYKRVRPQVFTRSNILGSFRGAGLYPLDPARVLDLLNTPLGPTTPENEPQQTEPQSSPWEPQTPSTTKQLDKQKKILDARLKSRDRCPSSPTQRLLNQVIKACQTAMTGATILAVENQALRAANEKQKRKRASGKVYLGNGGVLSGHEAQDRAKRAQINDNAVGLGSNTAQISARTRAPRKCSVCSSLDHNARSCPERFK